MDSRTDEQLVAAHLDGEREALAAIYDRYGGALYDTATAMLRDRHEAADVVQDVFLIAVERLGQLRDRTRLKAWLFAILRNEVYRRSRRRRRDRPTDFLAPGAPAMAAPADPSGEGGTVAYVELAESVRMAAAGLEPRDQLVLELSVRQGMAGAELAAALGVGADQSYVLVHRMRERIARSLGALTVARMGRKDCPELERLLAAWDGTFNVLVRKRVARHVDQCNRCGETSRRYAALTLIAAAPAFAAPPTLRDLVLERAASGGGVADPPYGFTADGGFPTVAKTARRSVVPLAAGVGAIVVLGASIAAIALLASGASDDSAIVSTEPGIETAMTMTTSDPVRTTTGGSTTSAAPSTSTTSTAVIAVTAAPEVIVTTSPPTTTTTTVPPPTPGFVELSTSVVDLGSDSGSALLTLTNSGELAVDWALAGDPAPFTWTSGPQSLGPGASSAIEFVLDRDQLAEGDLTRELMISTAGGGGGPLEVRARTERAPVVRIAGAPGNLSCPRGAPPPFVQATVTDESILSSVVLTWSGGGGSGSTPMREGSGGWSGRLDLEQVDGTLTYVVTATDERGNVGVDDGAVTVDGC